MPFNAARRSRAKSIVAVGALALAVLIPAATASANGEGVREARTGTAEYRALHEARADGYNLLRDASGIACIDNPGVGGMGIHYVNGTLVGDARVDPATPEAVIYEPEPHSVRRLVAVEYIVFQSAWVAAGRTKPPSLFAHSFTLQSSPNRYGLPPFYELHAWIWKHTRWARSTTGTPTSVVHRAEGSILHQGQSRRGYQ